ncbi:MAG: adenylate/guanylate cyclase domain-containing protein [Desulfobacteraceae bacterium]|nr:adenylate/guanylate cyclase domain-containing protein [Desulfobacteraceae bacterium]
MPIHSLAKHLKVTPFKIGCLVVLAAALVYHSFGSRKPDLLASLDNRVTDTMFQVRGPEATTGQVVIVDLDEKSLKKVGQWPWPRNVVARLVRNIQAAGAKVVGFDIVFAEEDRTSPKRYLDEIAPILQTVSPDGLARLREDPALDHDQLLGQAVAAAPAVLGYTFQTENDGLKDPSAVPFPSCTIQVDPPTAGYAGLALFRAYRAITNIPAVAQAPTEGFFNVFPDPSGTVRAVPLFMSMDSIPYPSLALEMLRLGLGEKGYTIHVAREAGQHGLLGVTLGNRFIRTDDLGQMTVNFRGPARTFPYVSAADVLAGKAGADLKGKYVLIGTSAAGLLDLRATPYSNVFPGVEVHANVIDNILAGDPFVHDIFTEIGITYTLIVVGGILLSALLAFTGPVAGALGGILVIEAAIIGNYQFFFLNHELVGVVYPLATVLAVFLTVTLFNYFFEGREKKFIHGAFGRYVSPQVVAELVKSPEKLTLKGEQRELTIFFSDIRGFTTISERMDSEQLGKFMNEYLTAMSNIVMAEQGMVDKFIGDAVMAIWGAPLPNEAHAVCAVRAALRMLARLRELQPGWQARGLPPIEIGIGLNTGVVSVGNFGSEGRFDYTVIGDNVNLASRLEGSNKLYGTNVIISELTLAALDGRFFCRFVDKVRVKGKNEPVSIYEPLLEGSPPIELRAEVGRFEEAVRLYQARDFEGAGAIFGELQQTRPHRLYALYLQRAETFCRLPPPADWDGCFTFTTK